MKKIVAVLTFALVASSAMADGWRHNGGYHGHHGGGWFVPAIVGGVVGYTIAQPRTVVVQQPPVVYQPAPVVVQQNQQVCETKLMVDPWGVQRMATICYQQ